MDTNASSFLMNPSPLCYQTREDDSDFIDLGLSLRTLQSEAYNHQSGHLGSSEGYEEIKWGRQSSSFYQREEGEEEGDGVQSKERWAFVKVNMDGVMVGRKICILDHGGYSSLAHQLEHMFGGEAPFGLRLLQSGSDFCLFYKDREDQWRTVGDVPWKEFVESVKRIRIARK